MTEYVPAEGLLEKSGKYVLINRLRNISNEIVNQCRDGLSISEVLLTDSDRDCILDNIFGMLWYCERDDQFAALAVYTVACVGAESYEDSKFWPQLNHYAGKELTQTERKNIKEAFKKGISYLQLPDIDDSANTSRNIDRYLAYSLVPNNYIDVFFDFIFKYYEKILNCQLPENADDIADDLSNYISSFKYDSGRDDFEEYPKPLLLPVCTRCALEAKICTNLLNKLLTTIDRGYRGYDCTDLGKNRFSEPFKRWYADNIGYKSKAERRRFLEGHTIRLKVNGDGSPCLIVPGTKCSPKAVLAFVIEKGTEKTAIEVPLTVIKLSDGSGRSIETTCYFKNLNLTPFSAFSIELDGKTIYKNPRRRKWVAFNESNCHIENPTLGANVFLFKDPDYDPNSHNNVRFTKLNEPGSYLADLSEGDSIDLCGDQYSIVEPKDDMEPDQIFIGGQVEDAFVSRKDGSGEKFILSNFLKVKCKLSDDTAAKCRKKLVKLAISIDGGEWFHRPIGPESIKNSDNVYVLPKEGMDVNGVHFLEMVLKAGDLTLDRKSFLLADGYEFSFDVGDDRCYHEKTAGLLTVSIREQPEARIEFSTRDSFVSYSFNDTWNAIFKIPSIFITQDLKNWSGPAAYSLALEQTSVSDSLFISSPRPFNVYPKKFGLEVSEQEGRQGPSGYPVYLIPLYGMKFAMKETPSEDYAIEVSIDHKKRFPLVPFKTHNEYKFSQENGHIIINMSPLTSNESSFKVTVNNKDVTVGNLVEGLNDLGEFDSS